MVIELDGSVGESGALFSGSACTVQCSARSAIDRKEVQTLHNECPTTEMGSDRSSGIGSDNILVFPDTQHGMT